MSFRIATAAASVHDRAIAHLRLLERVEIDVVLLAYLDAGVTARLAAERGADPRTGHVREFTEALRSLAPRIFLEPGLRIVTDAGGLNTRGAAQAAAGVLAAAGSGSVLVATVRGDDLVESLEELHGSGCSLAHSGTGAAFRDLACPILAAQAELGGHGVAEALGQGARVVLTGSVAASSLVLGAAVSEFGSAWDDWERLAAATAAGALLRQGTRLVDGGAWPQSSQRPVTINSSPPIADLGPQGQVAFSTAPGAGGQVTRAGIAACLASYAIDPAHFLTPDVDADLTSIQLAERPVQQDVCLWGATGRPAAASYNATLWYHDGFVSEAYLLVARGGASPPQIADLVCERVRAAGAEPRVARWETPGIAADCAAAVDEQGRRDARPTVVRLIVSDRSRDVVELFASEVAALAQCASELTLIGTQRPAVEPLVRPWPTVVPRQLIEPIVDVRPAEEWL